MDKVQKGQADTVICRRCKQEQSADEKYCINCGDRLLSPVRKSGGSSSGASSGSWKNSQQWKPKPVSPKPVKSSAGTSPAAASASLAEQQIPKPVSPEPIKNSADVSPGATLGSLTDQQQQKPKPVSPGPVKPSASQGAALGSLVEQQQRKHIRRARTIIIWIAVLTLLGSFILFLFVGTEPGLLESMKSTLKLNYNEFNLLKNVLTIEMWVSFFMGVVFLLMFIWARSNPFAAILTILVIFITQIIVMGAMNPQTLVSPSQIINVLIILALIRGVRAGLAYNKGKSTALQIR